MNKILNVIIITLSIVLFIMISFIVYRIIAFENHTITFVLNGATSIENTQITCKTSIKGCIIHLPSSIRNDGVVLGYSDNQNDTTAKFHQGENILIHHDASLYVISYRDIVVNIDKTSIDYIEKDSVNCLAYNENNSCKIKLPIFNKKGYQLNGYSESKELSSDSTNYSSNTEFDFSKNTTLYPIYTSKRMPRKEMVYNTKDVYTLNNVFIEFENSCSQDIVDTYKKIVNDIMDKAPYLFVGTKINILSSNTFLSIWGGNGNILGVNYNTTYSDYPISRTLDILSSYSNDLMEKYYVVVHEMGHSFDFYYGYGLSNPKEIKTDALSTYSSKSISGQTDMKNLYQKYLHSYGNKPLRSYSYTNVQEFTAEAFAYYYLKYIVPTDKYKTSYYPDDLKNTVEKYLCIAKNNYNTDGC